MKTIIIIGGLFVLFPNIFNLRERKAFSTEERIKKARALYSIDDIGDSVETAASAFYKRGPFHNFFYGSKYRELWSEPIKVKVFDIDTVKGGLLPSELGGGMQTISMDLLDNKGRKYDMRSINKDQANALPKWLRYTYARIMFRDQTAAINPYASLVIPVLAEAAGIEHTSPQLYFVPYDRSIDSLYLNAMAGRMAILERNLNDSWAGSDGYEQVEAFYDTEEMFQKAEVSNIAIDTLYYLKNRLFDMLINDWDRHEGQWEWALINKNDSLFFRSYPKDRDMAFYDFRGGIVNSVALLINNKFQSFTKEFKNVEALTKNSRELDQRLLSRLPKSEFVEKANLLQSKIGNEVIDSAFLRYPPEIYSIVGKKHSEILRVRKNNLLEAAEEFYKALH